MATPAHRILGHVFAQAAPQQGPLGGLLPPQVGTLSPPTLDSPTPPRPIPAPQPQMQGYFVDRMPKVIRKLLGKSTLADQCMDYWITQPKNINPENGLVGEVCRCILEVQRLKDWDKTKQFKAGVPEFAEASKSYMNLVSATPLPKKFDNYVTISATFPGPDIPTRPPGVTSLPDAKHNDKSWAQELEKWRVGSVVDGDTALELNELSFLIGNYNWCWLYKGRAERFYDPNPNQSLDPNVYNENLIKVTIEGVGLWAVDAYDFVDRSTVEKNLPGGQYLGFWNVDDGDEGVETYKLSVSAVAQNFQLCKDAGYYPKMGWCYVTNGVFNRYRDTVKDRGRDFFIYSTVQYLKHSFTFHYNQKTKKEVFLKPF